MIISNAGPQLPLQLEKRALQSLVNFHAFGTLVDPSANSCAWCVSILPRVIKNGIGLQNLLNVAFLQLSWPPGTVAGPENAWAGGFGFGPHFFFGCSSKKNSCAQKSPCLWHFVARRPFVAFAGILHTNSTGGQAFRGATNVLCPAPCFFPASL